MQRWINSSRSLSSTSPSVLCAMDGIFDCVMLSLGAWVHHASRHRQYGLSTVCVVDHDRLKKWQHFVMVWRSPPYRLICDMCWGRWPVETMAVPRHAPTGPYQYGQWSYFLAIFIPCHVCNCSTYRSHTNRCLLKRSMTEVMSESGRFFLTRNWNGWWCWMTIGVGLKLDV